MGLESFRLQDLRGAGGGGLSSEGCDDFRDMTRRPCGYRSISGRIVCAASEKAWLQVP